MSMEENESSLHKHQEADTAKHGDASAEAAGVARGAARSIGRSARSVGRSVGRSPIGSLPHQSALLKRRLPVRQVARVSDRLSTGYDWWSTAVESSEGKETLSRRVAVFGVNLVKNTILGLAVFGSYEAIVSHLSPPAVQDDDETKKILILEEHDDESGEPRVFFDHNDDYARAALPIHAGAGFVAGSVHGVATSLMETSPFKSNGVSMLRTSLPPNMMHHAVAHSLLFGSYEGFKRMFVEQLEDHEYYGGGYLAAFGVAGGLAGQVQHVASHYLEPWAVGMAVPTTTTTTAKAATRWTKQLWASAPALRPTLAAFLPSAIGFVAFEYGKTFAT